MQQTLFGNDLLYELAELLRSLMPLMAAIGTVSSIIGLWKMFTKWGYSGALSLLPFTRGWVFAKDSGFAARATYSISDGTIMVLTPIFYAIRMFGQLTPVDVAGFTFYVDTPMLVVTAIWAVAEVARFTSKVPVTVSLVDKSGQKRRWVLSWMVFPKISQVLWGFSGKFVKQQAVCDTRAQLR